MQESDLSNAGVETGQGPGPYDEPDDESHSDIDEAMANDPAKFLTWPTRGITYCRCKWRLAAKIWPSSMPRLYGARYIKKICEQARGGIGNDMIYPALIGRVFDQLSGRSSDQKGIIDAFLPHLSVYTKLRWGFFFFRPASFRLFDAKVPFTCDFWYSTMNTKQRQIHALNSIDRSIERHKRLHCKVI